MQRELDVSGGARKRRGPARLQALYAQKLEELRGDAARDEPAAPKPEPVVMQCR